MQAAKKEEAVSVNDVQLVPPDKRNETKVEEPADVKDYSQTEAAIAGVGIVAVAAAAAYRRRRNGNK